MTRMSRRQFVALAAAAASPAMWAGQPAGGLAAGEVLERLKAKLGGEWKPDGPDGLKVGDAATPVTGIVTTALPSLLVLHKAAEMGANLVVTSEPTFFARTDSAVPPVRRFPGAPPPPPDLHAPPDPVFTAKAAFLREHRMAVIRVGEAWRARAGNGFAAGLAKNLHLTGDATTHSFQIKQASLQTLAGQIKSGLRMRGGMRVVGDPTLRIRTLALLPGSTPIQAALDTLPHVDAIVAGEVREWEAVEYVRDAVALGGKKALIMVGRVVSEEPGMQACAEWLKAVVPEVRSTWIDAGDPYWRPTV